MSVTVSTLQTIVTPGILRAVSCVCNLTFSICTSGRGYRYTFSTSCSSCLSLWTKQIQTGENKLNLLPIKTRLEWWETKAKTLTPFPHPSFIPDSSLLSLLPPPRASNSAVKRRMMGCSKAWQYKPSISVLVYWDWDMDEAYNNVL